MKRAGILITLSILLFFQSVLMGQEIREEESLNLTYVGPAVSSAYNKAEYTGWNGSSLKRNKTSGYSISGGAALNIFADNLCGDFQIKYAYNQLDFAITNLDFGISGKYYYPINKTVSAGAGLGLYFESPPSNQNHNGSAGLQLPLTLLFNTTPDSKLFIDIYSRYGSFGIGESTKSISAGVNVGFIFKVGRM